MTFEKAVEILKANNEKRIAAIYASCKRLAIEALEKQIPKKPYSDNDNGIYEKDCCPTCHRSLFPNDHHCRCGQALDWSDTE